MYFSVSPIDVEDLDILITNYRLYKKKSLENETRVEIQGYKYVRIIKTRYGILSISFKMLTQFDIPCKESNEMIYKATQIKKRTTAHENELYRSNSNLKSSFFVQNLITSLLCYYAGPFLPPLNTQLVALAKIQHKSVRAK